MAETKKTDKLEREYMIPLRSQVDKVARYKRANKAIKTIKEFLAKHMKVEDRDLNKVRIDRYLNEFMWSRGIRNPPRKIKVKAVKEDGIVRAELAELPTAYQFKKTKVENRSQKASDNKAKKQPKVEEKVEEKTEEEKKDVEEKKASVVEAGARMEKAAAKAMKHQPQDQKKKATTPRRMALQK